MLERTRLAVLLISPDAEEASQIQDHLAQAGGTVQAHWASTLAAALDKVAERRFDVALLDLAVPDAAGPESFARLREVAPALPVVVAGSDDNEKLALRMVRAGAEDYFVKSRMAPPALARSLRYAVERHARRRPATERPDRRRKARVIGFIGAKGGVGTTTVAANVAVALARRRRPVIAAELRPYFGTMQEHFRQTPLMGDLSKLLAIDAETIDRRDVEACLARYSSELSLLPAPQHPGERGELTPARTKAIIDGLTGMAASLVLDLPADPTPATQEAVRACDFIGLVVDREPGCLRAAEVMARQVKRWVIRGLAGLIVVQRTPLACPIELDEITGACGLSLVEVIPPAPDACAMALKAGVPLVETYDDALIGATLEKIAAQLAADPVVIRRTA